MNAILFLSPILFHFFSTIPPAIHRVQIESTCFEIIFPIALTFYLASKTAFSSPIHFFLVKNEKYVCILLKVTSLKSFVYSRIIINHSTYYDFKKKLLSSKIIFSKL